MPEVARSVGISVSGLKKWLSGDSEPGLSYLPAISAVTGASIQWLATGESASARDSSVAAEIYEQIAFEFREEHRRSGSEDALESCRVYEEAVSLERRLQAIFKRQEEIMTVIKAEREGRSTELPADIQAIGEFLPVPVYDIRAAAGGGALVERENVETEVAFRADWLRALGVPPERLAVIRAVGNSMEPTICHGDALLLELEPERLIEGAVYVIAREDELLIKRPQKLGAEGLVLLSDNPDYRPVTYSQEEAAAMRIVGRVRWIGRVV